MATVQAYELNSHKIDADGNLLSATQVYIVTGVSSETAALTAVRSTAPSTMDNTTLDTIEVTERMAPTAWKVSANYTQTDGFNLHISKGNGSGTTDSFSCSATTAKRFYAISQTRQPSSATDVGLLIGYDPATGNVSGCDVTVADLRQTFTKTMKYKQLTTAWKQKMSAMVGTVNSKTFHGWEKHCVMFMGCSYSGVVGDKLNVSFEFAIRQAEEVTFPSPVGTVKKGGFDYAWTTTKEAVSSGKKKVELSAVYVAQVVTEADFGVLGV